MSRLVAATGRLTGDRDTTAALRLVLQLSAFAEHLANLRESQHRLHQARDARHAAWTLTSEDAVGQGKRQTPASRSQSVESTLRPPRAANDQRVR